MHDCMERIYASLYGEICMTVWRGDMLHCMERRYASLYRGDMHYCMERRYASLYGEGIIIIVWRGDKHHCMERYA